MWQEIGEGIMVFCKGFFGVFLTVLMLARLTTCEAHDVQRVQKARLSEQDRSLSKGYSDYSNEKYLEDMKKIRQEKYSPPKRDTSYVSIDELEELGHDF